MPTFVGLSVRPSVRRSLEKMSKIVKIQEFALEQKTKVNEHVEQTPNMDLDLLFVSWSVHLWLDA